MGSEAFKNKTFQRYFSYWLYVILSIGIPIGLIAWQFDLFRKPGPLQITGYGIITAIIVFFIIKGHIQRAITDMEKGIVRTVLINVSKIIPMLIFWIVLMFLESLLIKVKFILMWWIIGYLAATFVDIWHTKVLNDIKGNEQ